MDEMIYTVSFTVGKKNYPEDFTDKVEAKKAFDNIVADGVEVKLEYRRAKQ